MSDIEKRFKRLESYLQVENTLESYTKKKIYLQTLLLALQAPDPDTKQELLSQITKNNDQYIQQIQDRVAEIDREIQENL